MFDIFYIGKKPNLFPHELSVGSREEAQQRSRTRYCWLINTYTDYSDWDFLWEPVPWESNQTHVFPSQWQRDSETYLIPKHAHTDVNYRTDINLERNQASADVVIIDHQDSFVDITKNDIEDRANIVRYTKFVDNYLDTLLRIARNANSEHLWICSSVCDYTDFDFTWHPEPWQREMLHIFPSGDQKFGDTFYMHVPSFRANADRCELLDWYNNNFCTDQRVPRRPITTVTHDHDSHVQALAETQGPPLVLYWDGIDMPADPVVPLWRRETRAITPLNKRGSAVIVPRDAIGHIKSQLYDYDVVDLSQRTQKDRPLDVVFIENGEVNAEENYQHLEKILRGKPNKLHRVTNVKGRVAAYQAAANVSTTPWFFSVFAKLKIEESFDFMWQPDMLQQSKHYIFHARNPINGLEYGHMAMIAYNKKLVLSNEAPGLDFTLDQLHEVVPILSGVANYADDEFMAWRSAFREALKLKAGKQTMDTQYRLKTWLNKGEGIKGEWSKQGAKDAVEYYEEVNGDFDKLKLSYDWEWLKSYYNLLHA